MEKRKLRILTVVVFAGVLIFGALRQNSTGRGELGEIQVAMWNLGKVDNLQLSYEYRWKQNRERRRRDDACLGGYADR